MKTQKKGFTLIEIIIVLGIFVIALAFAPWLGNQFSNLQALERGRDTIKIKLIEARDNTIANTLDSNWGVAVFSDRIVYFKGVNYAARDTNYDQVINLDNRLSVGGLSEVVFSRPNGAPSNTGTITLNFDNKSSVISINSAGSISSQ